MDGAAWRDLLIVSKVGGTVGSELAGLRQRGCRHPRPLPLEAQHHGGRERLCPRCAAVMANLPEVLIRRWITSSRHS